MVKAKAISRSEIGHTRERKTDIMKIHRNPDPVLHPFEKPREYIRALNATKLDKVFAKPFVGALSGHRDGVYCMTRIPTMVAGIVSGSCDGEIKLWSLTTQKARISIPNAHKGFVRGVTCAGGSKILSCGDDKTIKIWDLEEDTAEYKYEEEPIKPLATHLSGQILSDISNKLNSTRFATSGSCVQLWDQEQSEAISKYRWGEDTFTTVRFNPVETEVLAAASYDRSICFYDIRTDCPVRKLIMKMRSNSISWNPIEAFNFVVANEDGNCYTYDMRKLDRALTIHEDHLAAVLSVDFSPTGREFVTGSYDKTLRIFKYNEEHSRDVYHTKRMQKIFSVLFSSDSTFVLSASDDTNIRLWKSQASAPLGTLHPRQKARLNYENKLKKRYQHVPEIRKIARQKYLPKTLYLAKKERTIMKESAQRKERNVIKHSKPNSVVRLPAREKQIVAEVE